MSRQDEFKCTIIVPPRHPERPRFGVATLRLVERLDGALPAGKLLLEGVCPKPLVDAFKREFIPVAGKLNVVGFQFHEADSTRATFAELGEMMNAKTAGLRAPEDVLQRRLEQERIDE